MCNKFRIEEFMVLELSVVTLVNTTKGSIRFEFKSFFTNFNSILVDLLPWKLKIKSPQVFTVKLLISLVFLGHCFGVFMWSMFMCCYVIQIESIINYLVKNRLTLLQPKPKTLTIGNQTCTIIVPWNLCYQMHIINTWNWTSSSTLG